MTFSNLKKREENQRRLHSPYDDTNEEKATITGDQNEFTQEQVEATWFSMCMRMQNKLDFIGLANRMKSIVPKITNYPQIEVIINNQLLLDDVLNIKNRILKTFVLGLHNSELSISYRLADQEEVGKVLTKNEVLELLMEKNPAMKKTHKGPGSGHDIEDTPHDTKFSTPCRTTYTVWRKLFLQISKLGAIRDT